MRARAARAAASAKLRTFALNAIFRRLLRKSGYFVAKSTMEFVAKVNDDHIPSDFYKKTSDWHVTLGDSDQAGTRLKPQSVQYGACFLLGF